MSTLPRRTPTLLSALFLGMTSLACAGLPIGDTADLLEPETDVDADEGEDDVEEDDPEAGEPSDDEAEGDDEEEGGEEDAPADDGGEAPDAAPAPAPAPKGAPVTTRGDGKVVLVGGGGRFPVPGNVPPGSYEIEVSFSGAEPIRTGKVTVGTDGATIQCKESMGLCRAK